MRPRKRFGQHFLEAAWVRKLVDVVAPAAHEDIVEIGPGRGALTLPLAERARRLLVVEVDRDLAAALAARVPSNVTVLTADVLEVDLALAIADWRAAQGPVRIVGNLPYNISSPILFRLLALAAGPTDLADAVLMLQREVADRIVAGPGGKDYGILSVLTALHADAEERLHLPPGAFRPMPRVHSAVVHLRFRPPSVPLPDPDHFVAVVRAAFGQRRKTLANALAGFAEARGTVAAAALGAAGIDAGRRAETLTLAEMARLAEVLRPAPGRTVL